MTWRATKKAHPYYNHLVPNLTSKTFKSIESIIDKDKRAEIEKYRLEEI